MSVVAIPLLAYSSDRPILHPWFEGFAIGAAIYNVFVSRSLSRGADGPFLSLGTAALDGVFLLALAGTSGGLQSVISIYVILAMTSACMRLSLRQSVGVAVFYIAGFVLLALVEGDLSSGFLPALAAYVFLTVIFVSPLVAEARKRFAEVLAGHRAQRELLHRLLGSEEEERRRIASELHDRGGGALFAMLHGLRRIRDLVSTGDQGPRGEVDRLIRVTETMVRELRAFIADLRPNVLDDLGLAEALRELLSRERALSGIRFSLDVDADAHPDSDTALAFYRVAQEAVTNIRRHAGARAAEVRLAHEETGWRLEIVDDGGKNTPWVPGMGVRTMHERIEALGGELEIVAANGSGTRITARVPERPVLPAPDVEHEHPSLSR